MTARTTVLKQQAQQTVGYARQVREDFPTWVEQARRSDQAARARVLAEQAWQRVKLAALATARYLAVCWMVLTVAGRWQSWADHTGIAQWHTRYKNHWQRDHDGEWHRIQRPHRQLHGVPKVKRWRLGQHHATVIIRIPDGHDVTSLDPAVSGPLRHIAHAKRASLREVKPGVAAVDLLRRDPLNRVLLVPHATGRDEHVVARDELGRARSINLGAVTHLLVNGETGSGKSSMVNALCGSMATTDDLMLMVDRKWGLEAQVLGDRWSAIATDDKPAKALFDKLLEIGGHRAKLLAWLMCQKVDEAEERYGIRLRRVRLVVDEVGQLSDDALASLLDVVSLARALGINVMCSGQRFGQDQGKKVTSIRAQLGGRIVGGTNDADTLRMALPGVDEDTRNQLLFEKRPGTALVQLGSTAELWRFPYRGLPVLRPLGQLHADKALPLDDLMAEDQQATAHLHPTLDRVGR